MVHVNIKRNIFNKLSMEFSEPEASILLGARQVGKTTLLRQLELEAKKKGYRTRFFDLEISSDLQALSGSPDKVFETISEAADVVFIDEFHYIKNITKIFKALYDVKNKVKIYASGSSSMEIHKHLQESLVGRFRKTMIFPLSLEEYSQLSNSKFNHYFQWGGLPGLIHRKNNQDKADLIENIISTYLTKDIKALIQEENVRAFNSLLYIIAQTQGQVAVKSNLARAVGLAENTLARYLDIMAQTYVCFSVPSYSKNLANEIKKSNKVYLYDLGIRNGLLKDFRPPEKRNDRGVAFETFIFLHLQSQLKSNMEIRFWRTKKGDEVDFVVLKNRVPLPIEVKSQLSGKRIPKNIITFLKHYPQSPYAVVYHGGKESFEVETQTHKVKFLPAEDVCNLEYLQDIF
jgi:uncharacterized protein